MKTLVDYGPQIEAELAARDAAESRWTAIRRLEDGRATDADVALTMAERRFTRAHELAARAVAPSSTLHRFGDRVDHIVTHRIAGPLVLFAVMWIVFRLVTDVAAPFVDWIDATLTGVVGPWLSAVLGAIGLGGTWVEALVVDGVLGGVGGMLAFVPVITILYIVLGMLEDTGYFARAAYLADKALAPVGLPGKSVLPLVVGFGCNVPALLATRVLERKRDRLLTALLVPFVSCTARLPVFVLLASVLFPGWEGSVVLGLYVLSVAAVFAVGLGLRHTLMRGTERAPFVLELPPYRRPSWRTVWMQTRQRTASFIRKAGTVILAASIVVWFFLAIPVRGDGTFGDVELDDSLFGATAESIGVVFTPAGFAAPELSGALAAGFVAKEIVVSTIYQTVGGEEEAAAEEATPGLVEGLAEIGIGFAEATRDAVLAIPGIVGIDLLGADDETATGTLAANLEQVFAEASWGHPQAAAMAFMVFVLLYVPCVATVATLGREFGKRWALFSVGLSMAVAWVAAVLTFWAGVALGGVF
ncbi:ferrous iron transport protein B [Pseudonocardia sp.]|uniref:ferrous iron transport protein B n=1 Tax=Pseudonocardia sp. TaxID=60912 RepID=UPI003D0CDDB4